LQGTEYDLVVRRTNWGEDRVFYYDFNGVLQSFPTNVTDVVQADAFARISGGRSAFRVDDLLDLCDLVNQHGAGPRGRKRV
jgi:hypothetical protein